MVERANVCGGIAAKAGRKHRLGVAGKFLWSFFGLALLGMLAGYGTSVAGLQPDTIVFNGKIVTVDKDFSIAEAVAVRDGRFVAVGSNTEVKGLAGDRTQMFDLAGRTVLPGFNDPHEHFAHTLGFAVDELTEKFRAADSIEEIANAVKEKVSRTQPGELVWFFLGPDSESLAEKRFPTRQDLDPISSQNPVVLEYGGKGENLSANTLALKKAGITAGTPQPFEKGLMGRIVENASGEPTGVFLGRGAASLVHSALIHHSVETLAENILHASRRAIPYGITTIGDPNTNMSDVSENINWVRAYQQLSNDGNWIVRVNCIMRLPLLYRPVEESLQWLQNIPYSPGFGNERLRFGQIKIAIYDSTPEYKLRRDDVIRAIKAVHKAGWRLYIHVGQGESYDLAMEGLEEAYREFPRKDVRHVITHARFPTDKNLEVLKRYDVIVEPQTGPIWGMSDDYEEQNADPARPAFGPAPLRTYLDRGIVVMTGSDSGRSPTGVPLFTIFESVNRVRKSGKVINPEERITVEEAIRAVTVAPAYSTFEENLKGSIEAGKLADMVVLGRDILTAAPLEIKDIPILRTMIGGRFVYTNPIQNPN